MNFPQALAEVTGLRAEECLEGTEAWGLAKRLTVKSKKHESSIDGLDIFTIQDLNGNEFIYTDIAGFPTTPLDTRSTLGRALYRLVGIFPAVEDERVFFRPRPVSSLLDKFETFRRIDLKTIDIDQYAKPMPWEFHPTVAGVLVRMIPSRVRSLAEVDLSGVRTVITPDCAGLT
jgi:hypothetical protein